MKLYRYQPINELTISNLIQGKNWVSDPLNFNDPFELRVTEIKNSNNNSELVYLDEQSRYMRVKYNEIVSSHGVVCYSKVEPNLIMYSHYADKHKGMCLEFNIPSKNNYKLKKVKYCIEFEKIQFSLDPVIFKDEIEKIMTTKSIHWNSEEEYREIFASKECYSEYPGMLTGIIFGCKTNRQDIVYISSLFENKMDKIEISKSFVFPNSFKLGKSTAERDGFGSLLIPENW
jgi:hypothetical protein